MFIALMAMIFVCSCSKSPEQKAQSLIKSKLKETLHDPKSYESVKFSTLDSVYTTLEDNLEYLILKKKFDWAYKKAQEFLSETKIYSGSRFYRDEFRDALKGAEMMSDSMTVYVPILEKMEKEFVPEFNGWKMEHSFRSNNAMGAKTLGSYVFYFNNELKEIIEYKELK